MSNAKISTGKMVAYSLTEASLLMISFMFSSQYMFFMTDIIGITAGAAGVMFLVTRIWDAVNDPLMGVIADKNKSRYGVYRPFILIGGIPLAIGLPLAFTNFHLSPGWSLFYVYVTYTLFGMAYTCIFIPYTSMIGKITSTNKERVTLSSMKGAFQALGVLLASSLTVPLVKRFSGTGALDASGYQKTALLYMVVALILFFITFIVVKENTGDARASEGPKYKISYQLIRDVILKNTNLLILVAVYFFMYLRMFINNTSVMYFFVYVAKKPQYIAFYMMIMSGAVIVASVLLPKLARKIGKRKITLSTMFLAALSYAGLYIFRLSDAPLFFAMTILTALFSAAPYLLIWSFVTDVADETEERIGFRADGLMVSTTSFANKLGAALAGAISGIVLDMTGYVPNAAQSVSAIFGIECLLFILPGLCCLVIGILLLFYSIKD